MRWLWSVRQGVRWSWAEVELAGVEGGWSGRQVSWQDGWQLTGWLVAGGGGQVGCGREAGWVGGEWRRVVESS